MSVTSLQGSKVETRNDSCQRTPPNLDMQVLPSENSIKSSHKCSCVSTFSHFSFPWTMSTSRRLSWKRRRDFPFPAAPTTTCVSGSGADQLNFTLETSTSVSDKRARQRPHWSMGSGTGCQQGRAPMNNKYVHINMHRILGRSLDVSGCHQPAVGSPSTKTNMPSCDFVCSCGGEFESVCGSDPGLAGDVWEGVVLGWKAALSNVAKSAWHPSPGPARRPQHTPRRAELLLQAKKERMWTRHIYISSSHVLIHNEWQPSVPLWCLRMHYPSHM